MCDTCGDNRFELIEKYKQKLLDATNIEDSPEEMAVIDNILFRFWQMGWLKGELFGNSEQLNDTISRQAALGALGERPVVWSDNDDYTLGARNQYDMDRLAIETLPPAQSEQISKINDLVEGTIDHFDKDDAMDLLYAIKGVLKNG